MKFGEYSDEGAQRVRNWRERNKKALTICSPGNPFYTNWVFATHSSSCSLSDSRSRHCPKEEKLNGRRNTLIFLDQIPLGIHSFLFANVSILFSKSHLR